jgi:hypothetical protein
MIKQMRRAISIVILAAFISTSVKSPAYAEVDKMPFMSPPGVIVHLSPEYTPAYLKGIVIHPENAFKFDFIVYKGDTTLTEVQKKEEYTKLTKYFLASLAIPDDDQWVNLSPYEKDRIINDDFGKTEMGRDLLAQDYMLKQITASLIYPEDNLGKKFWDRVYTQAQEQYGTTNIPVNTFNKVWILPDDALIYEKGNTAYVIKNHLRVMMEEDYLSLQKHSGIQSVPVDNKTHTIASKIIKEIVLPELEREVNEGKNFAALRQVYSGMLLAAWYKRALKESLLSKIYANKGKIKGVDQDPKTNEQIYQQYLKAYKKGVYNYIKEEVVIDPQSKKEGIFPRKYFSGGGVGYAIAANELGLKTVINTTGSPTPVQNAAMAAEFKNNKDDLVLEVEEERGVSDANKAMTGTTLERLNKAWQQNAKVGQDSSSPPVIAAFMSYLATGKEDELVAKLNENSQDFTEPNISRFGQAILTTLASFEKQLRLNSEQTEAHVSQRDTIGNALLHYGGVKADSNDAFESGTALITNAKTLLGMLNQKQQSEGIRKLAVFFEEQLNQVAPQLDQARTEVSMSVYKGLLGIDPEEMRKFSLEIIGFIDKINQTEQKADHFKALVQYLGKMAQEKAFMSLPILPGIKIPVVPKALELCLTKVVYPFLKAQEDDIQQRYALIASTIATLSLEYSFSAQRVSARDAEKATEGIREVLFQASSDMIKSEAEKQNRSTDFVLDKVASFSRVSLEHELSQKNIQMVKDKISADKAMMAQDALNRTVIKDENFGGIDFNASNLNLKIKRDGNGVPLPFGQQDISSISNLEGLEPIILEIRPAIGLLFFPQLQGSSMPANT